jgi:hypothetical protein
MNYELWRTKGKGQTDAGRRLMWITPLGEGSAFVGLKASVHACDSKVHVARLEPCFYPDEGRAFAERRWAHHVSTI